MKHALAATVHGRFCLKKFESPPHDRRLRTACYIELAQCLKSSRIWRYSQLEINGRHSRVSCDTVVVVRLPMQVVVLRLETEGDHGQQQSHTSSSLL
jgi:hypothetical protein